MPDSTTVTVAIDELVARHARDGLTDKVHKLIDQFAENANLYTTEQASTVDLVIARLVADVTPEGRLAIAERVASDPKAPPRVIEQLAEDDWIDVAAPVLAQSPCLSDETLLRVIDGKGHSHLLAISRRRTIAPAVADTLAVRGNRAVVRSLARNAGAELSPQARAHLEKRQRTRTEELRRAPRKSVEYPAEIVRHDGGGAVRCRLIDVSSTGARVSLATMARLSGELTLSFANAAVQRACELVWQDGREIGVRFV
ncbi:MAG: hypothetical protein FD152_2328 [Xanthobacteraceae bacterium]|nr:MAG: hypothetical protein FD152_2328 [Xanthobacteraceae bacterium]